MLGAVPLVFLVAHLSFRAAVAYAIAYAPNGGGLGSAPAGSVAPVGAEDFRVSVGPPSASIAAWVLSPVEKRPVRGTVVLLHGIRMDRSSMVGFADAFVGEGYRAVLIDLRGHGASTGEHLTYGQLEAHDVSQVIDAIEARHGRSPTFVFGYSYGGAVAIHVAQSDDRVSGVVAVSTFSSMRRVVVDYEHRFLPALEPWIPDSWVSAAVDDAGRLAEFDPDRTPESAVRRARSPLLFIHGDADTQVPPSHARTLLTAAGPRAELALLKGETHESVLADRRGLVANQALGHFARFLRN